MKIEIADGKKLLTAKDPQGKLLFSGPVESKESSTNYRRKCGSVTSNWRRKICPAIAPNLTRRENNQPSAEQDNENNDNESDADESDSESDGAAGGDVLHVCGQAAQQYPYRRYDVNWVLL